MNDEIRIMFREECSWESPVVFFRRLGAPADGFLMTGKDGLFPSGFSVIGTEPAFSLVINETEILYEWRDDSISSKFRASTESGGHVAFEQHIAAFAALFDPPEDDPAAAFVGAMGYAAYDALTFFEKIRLTGQRLYDAPLFQATYYRQYHLFDHAAKKVYSIRLSVPRTLIPRDAVPILGEITEPDEKRPAILTEPLPGFPENAVHAECTREEYCAKVEGIRRLILDGEVYELNLSQPFSFRPQVGNFDLFEKAFAANPAPYSSFFSAGNTTAVSNSPELFIFRSGEAVLTKPIKGTAPRFDDPAADERSAKSLLASEKDGAELAMIVDLLRNDLGKICTVGSITVEASKQLERFSNVHHLVGVVRGTLREGTSFADIFRAVFPGGSITGCPKYRSMELIDRFEKYRRGLYTGTAFVTNRLMTVASILIRTAVIVDGTAFLHSGGAVTIDSDPESEYDEIVHKAATFFGIVAGDKNRGFGGGKK